MRCELGTVTMKKYRVSAKISDARTSDKSFWNAFASMQSVMINSVCQRNQVTRTWSQRCFGHWVLGRSAADLPGALDLREGWGLCGCVGEASMPGRHPGSRNWTNSLIRMDWMARVASRVLDVPKTSTRRTPRRPVRRVVHVGPQCPLAFGRGPWRSVGTSSTNLEEVEDITPHYQDPKGGKGRFRCKDEWI